MASWASRCSCPCRKGARCLSFPSGPERKSRTFCVWRWVHVARLSTCVCHHVRLVSRLCGRRQFHRGHPVEVGGLFVWCPPGPPPCPGSRRSALAGAGLRPACSNWCSSSSALSAASSPRRTLPQCLAFLRPKKERVPSLSILKACWRSSTTLWMCTPAPLSLSPSTGHEGCLSLSLPVSSSLSLSL